MSTTADGGGGDGFPHTQYYDPGEIHGGGAGQTGSGPQAESLASNLGHDAMLAIAPLPTLILGGGGGDVRAEVEKAMKASNPDGLKQKAQVWSQVSTKASSYSSTLSGSISKITGAWEGDDADQAFQILRGLHATLSGQSTHAANMSSALDNMGTNLQSVKDSYGHDTSTAGGVANYVTGNQDRGAADAYKALMGNFKDDMGIMPQRVPTEIKPGGASTIVAPPPPPPGSGAPGGAPSVGGPGSAAHGANPTPAHIQQPNMHNPNMNNPNMHDPNLNDPNLNNPPYPNGPGGVSPYNGGGSGIGLPGGGSGIGLPGGGSGPGLDTGGSLAGLDPSGGAGAGLGGAGDGSGVTGGGLGAGAGGGLGAGAGGAGTGGGLGAGAGTGTAGVGAGGRGMMMPMHGSGQGDEDERERSTWLSEDDDVWGAEEDVPTVIT